MARLHPHDGATAMFQGIAAQTFDAPPACEPYLHTSDPPINPNFTALAVILAYVNPQIPWDGLPIRDDVPTVRL